VVVCALYKRVFKPNKFEEVKTIVILKDKADKKKKYALTVKVFTKKQQNIQAILLNR
jgi:hypothetical protein